jgi:hypothetical protein
LAVVVAVVVSAAVRATPALAYDCSVEYGVFMGMTNSSGGVITNSIGAINNITLHDHMLGCGGTGQTTRILLGGQPGNWAEVGWKEKFCGSSHCFVVFTESQYTDSSGTHPHHVELTSYNGVDFTHCLVSGSTLVFKILMNGNGTATGYINCLDGTGPHAAGPNIPTGQYNSGNPEGEEFRHQGDGIKETHSGLQYRDSAGAWHYSGGVYQRHTSQDDPCWAGEQLSATSFDLKQISCF